MDVLDQKSISRLEIANLLEKDYPTSKITLIRDLNKLIKLGLVNAEGKGKGIVYSSKQNPVLRQIDIEEYFSEKSASRNNAKKSFDFSVIPNLKGVISPEEQKLIEKTAKKLSAQKKIIDPTIFKREIERFTVEFSWKSSKIEGNTYSLLETEVLIKQAKEAFGHPKYEAVMILNHKKAIDFILENRNKFKKFTLENLLKLHNILTKDLEVSSGIRKGSVAITGTNYVPPRDSFTIKKALLETINLINKIGFPVSKALIAACMISHIQPFSGGNKRTARTLSNAILLAHDFYPLSYRDMDEVNYIKGLLIFYEQGSLYHFKKIFLDQFDFASKNYFQS